jgi:ATP adenylyltransferase
MKQLWAPWRLKYIEQGNTEGCIFCVKPGESRDAENYIVHRGRLAFVMLNLYPYTGGHMMVAPYEHAGSLEALSGDQLFELVDLTRQATRALRLAFHPDGFNVGLNIGEAAGAGFGDHVHVHVVPRWAQDTNFMPVLTDTKIISEALDETYERLVEAWNSPKE